MSQVNTKVDMRVSTRTDTKGSQHSKKSALGAKGEMVTALYLRNNGYLIVERNFRCRYGEIDIIAIEKRSGTLCFVEVKTRSGLSRGRPCESVTERKKAHIRRVAYYYAAGHKAVGDRLRIDTAEVLRLNGKFYIRYNKNVA